MKQTWSINQSIIIIKQEGVKNHIVPESSRSLQQKFHRIPAWLGGKSLFIFFKAANNSDSLTKNLYFAHYFFLSIFSCENTSLFEDTTLRLFSFSADIMIGFSLLQLSFTIIAVSMSFLKMGQLFANKWQQMCAITGDHVYFITDVSLQICAVYFDPIWKPDALVVESLLW